MTHRVLQIYTAVTLWIATATALLYSTHLLDRALYSLLDRPPFVGIVATPMGWGAIHLPTAVVAVLICAAVPAAWYTAVVTIHLMELLLRSQFATGEEATTP